MRKENITENKKLKNIMSENADKILQLKLSFYKTLS